MNIEGSTITSIATPHARHSLQLMREAVRREMESELRGLIMAARMHRFRLAIEGKEMRAKVFDEPDE